MALPRVFVSSAPADATFCAALVTKLRAAGADVWYDPTGIGDTEHELATRAAFLVVVSPAALSAPQVQVELAGALRMLRAGSLRTLIPVILDGCTIPAGLASFASISIGQARSTLRPAELAAVLALLEAPPESPEPRASSLALVPQTSSATLSLGSAEPLVLPPQLSTLGFTGWHVGDLDIIVPPLCVVAGGTFVLGDAAAHATLDEQPPHRVQVATFAIATFAVTVAEYACFVGAGHALPPDVGRITWSGQFSRLDHPVVNVSWHDATAYAAWLAVITGGSWRLPTEVEWEYAARWDAVAQHCREYPWGDAFDIERCNTRESSIGATTPIHLYANGASPCGARDMLGNVREWTRTAHAPYPYDATDGRERPGGSVDRIQRGGSWFSFASEVRAATREWQAPDAISPYVGFRLALDPPPTGGARQRG